jgi:SAM-dependent methyltransferase
MNLVATMAQLARRVVSGRVASRRLFRAEVEGKSGLEIGGPSEVFGDAGEAPLYRYVASLDNCVFSVETIWEGKRQEGNTFVYHPRKSNGFNLIREATDLHGIANEKYDFLLSSHNLEHISNPVKALREWMRVVKRGGAIIIFLPYFRRTFDHRRQPTPVTHMIEDSDLDRGEDDLTHLPEILELHDLSRDPAAGSKGEFYQRSLRNFENRCLHHHVFDENNSRELLQAVGLAVEITELARPFHIAILARCPLAP